MAREQQRYKVLEKIASGGMAEVFRAESAGLEGFKKIVAIKRVLPHLSEKKQFIGMFLDEARLSAHLSHSNVAQVFDIGVGDNTYFIVMEYVDGADLKAIIERYKKLNQLVPIEEACLICVRICEGLAYAHELADPSGRRIGIVHRDMSPPNVLITRHGEVKIVDFGLAKANSQLEKSEPGIIKGKFSYLSPEAALGQPVDARTDIFAVGIILWEMLAGRRLFMGETDLETVRQVQSARVPPIRQFNPNVTPELEAVMARALAQNPKDRYQSARDLGHDLNQMMFHLGRPVSSFDIAQLVNPVVQDREFEKEQKRSEDRGSIIGSLIDEALIEFSSLKGDESGDGSEAVAPLVLGDFESTADWANDLDLDPSRTASSGRKFELGNLAALEDEAPSRRASSDLSSDPSVPLVRPPSRPRAPEAEPPPAPAAVQKSGGKGGLIALLLLLVVVAAVVGAYFKGLIPPNLIPH